MKPAETEICISAPSCGRSLDTTFHAHNLPQEPPLLLPLQQEQQEQEQQEQPYQEPAYAWKITGYTDCTASCLGGELNWPKLGSFDRSSLPRKVQKVLEKSAHPPSSESPLKY